MSVITIGIRRTRRRRRRGKANHFCVCPHKNAKAAASVFATDDHCSNNDKSELRQKCVRVCVLMRSPNNLLSSFSSCTFSLLLRKFFSSSLSLIFHLHLQQRRIKNEPRKTGDVVARARRARRSVSLFILLFLLGLLLSLSVSLISNRLLATDD